MVQEAPETGHLITLDLKAHDLSKSLEAVERIPGG